MAEYNPTHARAVEQDEISMKGKASEVRRTAEDQVPTISLDEKDIWKLYTDGAFNDHRSGAGLILIDPEGVEPKDSGQDEGRKDACIRGFEVGSKPAVQSEGLTKGVLVEELNELSVDMAEVNIIVEEAARTWMTPIQEYIEKGILPEDTTEARIIREKARNYVMEDGILYRKSYLGPLLRCIDEENEKALRLNLNLLEERREIAAIKEARRKQQVEKYYNQRVHHKQFKAGEFVLRKNELSKVENTANSDQNGKDHTRSSKHMAQVPTSSDLWREQKYHEHDIQLTYESITCNRK
ncbi:hypothetical protein Tco_0469368 [Tanacetum coccineum]